MARKFNSAGTCGCNCLPPGYKALFAQRLPRRNLALHAGRLQDLQGVCVPTLYASGYWRGYLMFALATSVIHGRHPEAGQESAAAAASAEQVCRQAMHRGCPHRCTGDQGGAVYQDWGRFCHHKAERRCLK